jgi:hypothetical protein
MVGPLCRAVRELVLDTAALLTAARYSHEHPGQLQAHKLIILRTLHDIPRLSFFQASGPPSIHRPNGPVCLLMRLT